MRVCDICRSEEVHYTTSAVVNARGNCRQLELCYACYKELTEKEQEHRHLAYIETVENRTGKILPKKTSLIDMLLRRRKNDDR